jgi:hypothetical protein
MSIFKPHFLLLFHKVLSFSNSFLVSKSNFILHKLTLKFLFGSILLTLVKMTDSDSEFSVNSSESSDDDNSDSSASSNSAESRSNSVVSVQSDDSEIVLVEKTPAKKSYQTRGRGAPVITEDQKKLIGTNETFLKKYKSTGDQLPLKTSKQKKPNNKRKRLVKTATHKSNKSSSHPHDDVKLSQPKVDNSTANEIASPRLARLLGGLPKSTTYTQTSRVLNPKTLAIQRFKGNLSIHKSL